MITLRRDWWGQRLVGSKTDAGMGDVVGRPEWQGMTSECRTASVPRQPLTPSRMVLEKESGGSEALLERKVRRRTLMKYATATVTRSMKVSH